MLFLSKRKEEKKTDENRVTMYVERRSPFKTLEKDCKCDINVHFVWREERHWPPVLIGQPIEITARYFIIDSIL